MLTVCVLAVAFALQTSSPAEPKQPIVQNGERTTEGTATKNEEQQKTVRPITLGGPPRSNDAATKAGNGNGPLDNGIYSVKVVSEPTDWWFIFSVGVNAILAAAAFCTLFFMRKQTQAASSAAIAAQSSVQEARKGVVEARNSARAANLTAQALINSERAWFEIDVEPCWDGHTQDEAGGPVIATGFDGWYSLKVSNYGRTMAIIEKYRVMADCLTKGVAIRPHNYSHTFLTNIRQPIRAGTSQEELRKICISHLLIDRTAVESGEKTGVIVVEITYWDIVTAGTDDDEPKVALVWFLYNNASGVLERILDPTQRA